MERTLDTATASLVYTDTGVGKGTLVVLHHWGGSGRTWARVVARLAPRVRCIALHQRGWGRLSARDGRNDLDALVGDVVSLVAALDPGLLVLVGHSSRRICRTDCGCEYGVSPFTPGDPAPGVLGEADGELPGRDQAWSASRPTSEGSRPRPPYSLGGSGPVPGGQRVAED